MQRLAVALLALVAVSLAQDSMVPPFLEGESSTVVEAFNKLLASSDDLTDAELASKVDDFMSQQSSAAQEKYAAFQAAMKEFQKQEVAAHDEAVSHFSDAAKEADAKLTAIAVSTTLTLHEKNEQTDALIAGLPADVREEIIKAMQGN